MFFKMCCKRLNLKLFLISLLFLICSCSSSSNQDYISESKNAQAAVPERPHDAPEYVDVLKKWERDVTLYKDFEMYFSGTATLMVPEMLEAYKKRVEKVQGVTTKIDKNIIPEDRDTLSVVVSMYTSSAKFVELDDSKIWNCALFYNNKWISPSNIVYYRNKSSFVPYFSIGTQWSRVYVLQFHVPHFDVNNLNNESSLVFSMHSGIAKADYYWR